MATSLRTYNVLKFSTAPCVFCEESFGSEICRAFRERVGLWILSLKSADYFGRSEYFSSRKKAESLWEKLQWWGKPVGCCKLPFYANEFCDKHACMHIVGDDWNDTPCSSLFSSLAMMQFRIEAIDIRVFFTRTTSIQKQIVEYIRFKK